ncbi:MAG: amidohydrolase [Planctomycetota bacterium]
MSRSILSLCAAVLSSSCLSGKPPWMAEEYVLVSGGTIYPSAEAEPVEALFVEDGRVVALGTKAEMEARAKATDQLLEEWMVPQPVRRIDLGGGVAVPGLVDAHGHLESLGETLESVDLVGCGSVEELIERVAARASTVPAGTWIVGRGWDQTRWTTGEFPEHAALSARVPEHPVYLERVDGHAAFVNQAALSLAKLTGGVPLPPIEGGKVVLDENGAPTGVLVDAATNLVTARIPPPDAATRKRRILAAQQALLACGLVGMHDMGTVPETLAVLRELEDDGELKLRVASYLWANDGLAPFGKVKPERDLDAKLRIVGAKLMVDGALGSRGAALLEDYSDAPGERGLIQMSAEAFQARVEEVFAAGLQPAAHAIGDAGNRRVLEAYALALAKNAKRSDLRPRIEHAQVVAAADWARFDELGVIPSMQPTHATSDMRWAEQRLGMERAEGAYAWKKLAGPHAPLAFGSDFPVERPQPLEGLYAAITRQDKDGHPPGGWRADQALDARTALAAFTSGAAYAAHEETRRGKLLVGYAADLSVFDVDPLRCEPQALLSAKATMAIIDGELVWPALLCEDEDEDSP